MSITAPVLSSSATTSSDATNFFSTCTPVAPKTTCTAKDTLHQNQYGFTFGGPVRIPHLYNGTNKLFFFTGYQFEKSDSSAATSNAYVPTAANLAGDFSTTDPAPTSSGGTGVANTCSGVEQLYDPVTGALLPDNKYSSAPTFNAASLKLLSYLPKVSPLADGSDACGHVAYAIPQLIHYKQFVTRIDYTINSKNNLYGRYFLDGYQSPAPFSPNNILFTTQSGNVERVQNFTLGENWTITSSTVNSVHATVSRRVNNRGYNPADINLSNLGISSSVLFQLVPNGLQLTNTTSGKSHGFTIGGGTNSVSHFNDNAFSVSDDVTLVRGKHQFVIGGEYVRNELNISNAYESNGTETFNGIYSSNGPTGTGCGTGGSSQCAAGDANLDFLWGSMSAFQQSKQQQNALRAPIPSLYVQDTFHATPQITIVAGVRWEPEYYPHDYFNRGTAVQHARISSPTRSAPSIPTLPPARSSLATPASPTRSPRVRRGSSRLTSASRSTPPATARQCCARDSNLPTTRSTSSTLSVTSRTRPMPRPAAPTPPTSCASATHGSSAAPVTVAARSAALTSAPIPRRSFPLRRRPSSPRRASTSS